MSRDKFSQGHVSFSCASHNSPWSRIALASRVASFFCAIPKLRILSSCFVAATAMPLALAAPPTLTSFSPTGGQQGQEVRVVLKGTFDPASLRVYSSAPGIELAGVDGKDAVKLKISNDAPLGISWLAFYSDEGATKPRAFVVGALPEQNETENNNLADPAMPALKLPLAINGQLTPAGDVDVFPVELKSGESLVAICDANDSFDSPLDGVLQVADSRGFVQLQSDDRIGRDPCLAFVAPRDGRYYIRIFGFPANPDSSIQFVGGADYVYRLTLANSGVKRVTPQVVTSETAGSVKGIGWNGQPLSEQISIPPLLPGFHPVISKELPSVGMIQAVTTPIVIAKAGKEPTPVEAIPCCLSGALAVRDDGPQKWTIAGKKGEQISIRVATRALGSPLDAVLRMTNSKGQRVQEVDDALKESYEIAAVWKMPVDDTYTLEVRDRFDRSGEDFVYTMLLDRQLPIVFSTKTSLVKVSAAGTEPEKMKGQGELELEIDRNGNAEPWTLTVEGLPEGCTFEAIKSEMKKPTEKTAKIKFESVRGESWIGPIRVTATDSKDGRHILHKTSDGAPILLHIPAKKAK